MKTIKKIFLTGLALLIANSAFAKNDFLVITDTHYDPNQASTTYYSLFSETGVDLWQATIGAVKKSVRQHPIDFAVILGDLPAHRLSVKDKINSERQVFADLRKTLGNIPIIYVPGNNDALGGNYHSYTEFDGSNIQFRPDQLDTGGTWPAQGLTPCTTNSNSACIISKGPSEAGDYFYGAYSVYPLKNHALRFISLNSMPFVAGNQYVSDDGISKQTAIEQEFDWLNEQLADATSKHEKVLIGMHIPPGYDAAKQHPMWNPQATAAFNASMIQYHDVISGVLTAHTHYEGNRFIRDNKHKQSIIVYSAPGIHTGHGNNPGFKIMSLDNSLDISDALLVAANSSLKFDDQFTYQKAYQSFCAKNLTLHACLDKLDSEGKFYPLMKLHYALGNTRFNHFDGVENSTHINISVNASQ